MYAAISADIVSSTSLSKEMIMNLSEKIKGLLTSISNEHPGFWGRLVKGDTIECITDKPNDALRIAIMLKCFVKSFRPADGIENKNFKQCGLRIAIGIGAMRTVDPHSGIMDGEAIYLSGRALEAMSAGTTNKTKDGFRIVLPNDSTKGALDVISSFINYVLNSASSRRCEVIFYRLQNKKDLETASILGVSRANVNSILNKAGWSSLEKAIIYFENLIF